MNQHYQAFIQMGKTLAENQGLTWDFPLDEEGNARDGIGWNLTASVGDAPPPTHYLRDLGTDRKTLAILHQEASEGTRELLCRRTLSDGWKDLIKAAVTEQLFYKRNTTTSVIQNVIRPIRVIATCAEKEPWEINLDDVQKAILVGKSMQASGKLGDSIAAIVKLVFDTHHICNVGPIYPFLSFTRTPVRSVKSKHTMSQDELLERLEERKREERLPEKRAFWELVRIVWTESPRTLIDELRFTAVQTMIITGFRIGEAALLPVDWKRERTYVDHKGKPAGEVGGISSSLMLRHFAEKQQTEESDSRLLRESVQPIPEMFRQTLEERLHRTAKITQPLRETLRKQCETGRLLPWFHVDEIVPFIQLYPCLTGNPFWLVVEDDSFIERYRKTFDPHVLHDLHQHQLDMYASGDEKLNMAFYMFANRLLKQMQEGKTSLRFRNKRGEILDLYSRKAWGYTFLHIGELESHIRANTRTKVSDTTPLAIESGLIQPWEFLFLHPKRSLSEERNDGLCDLTRYVSINRPDPTFIGHALGDAQKTPSLFEKYGHSDDDRILNISSHSLRHLQNTELFRLGVADTIISKRYNRRSVAQSYEYDHRSLAEELDQIDIPEEVELMLGGKTTTVAKMILAGRANGPIVDSFRRIQAKEGDTAAYEYLRTEADGFHATPYGHCLNSFTVDPCPKHLECFANCRHLSATDLPENRENLIRLERKFKAAIETIESRPSVSIGWRNQLEHAQKRLGGVQRLLTTPAGERVFPNGEDLSLTTKRSGVIDV